MTVTTVDEYTEALDKVTAAGTPVDLFGDISDDPAAQRAAKRGYRKLAPLIHPDRATSNGIPKDKAEAAFAKLGDFYKRWTEGDVKATPVTPTNVTVIRGKLDKYVLGDVLAEGTVSTVYDAGDSVVKIPRHPRTSKLLQNEAEHLSALREFMVANQPGMTDFYPELRESMTHRSKSGTRRLNVLRKYPDGFVSLAAVKKAYPGGLDGRDYAWMHRRLLAALAAAHDAGIVHGAVLPDNVLIHPEQHGLILSGWTFSGEPDDDWKGKVKSYLTHYPASDTLMSYKSDVYMAHSLMASMLQMTERKQHAFAAGCMQSAAGLRPEASGLIGEYDELLMRLYGARKFRPFSVPGGN